MPEDARWGSFARLVRPGRDEDGATVYIPRRVEALAPLEGADARDPGQASTV